MQLKSVIFLAFLGFFSGWGTAHALKSDRDQPMHIDADAMQYDDRQQVTTFTGNVAVNKGSIVLRGHRLVVRELADGTQHGTMEATAGSRAFFRQARDVAATAAPQHVEGEAERIEYDSASGTVRLLRRAQLRRFEGAALSDDITGALITYNTHTEVFSADGAQSAGSRVRAVIKPRSSTDSADDKK